MRLGRKPLFAIRITCTVHELGTLIVDMDFKGNKEFDRACRRHGITSEQVDEKIKQGLFIPMTGWAPEENEDEQEPER